MGRRRRCAKIPWTPGKEFEVVTISMIRARPSTWRARKRRSTWPAMSAPRPAGTFLTDKDGNAKRLAELIGFHYRYDERQEQYAHSAAIFVLTPEGRVSRYLYGARYRSRDLRFALAEASETGQR